MAFIRKTNFKDPRFQRMAQKAMQRPLANQANLASGLTGGFAQQQGRTLLDLYNLRTSEIDFDERMSLAKRSEFFKQRAHKRQDRQSKKTLALQIASGLGLAGIAGHLGRQNALAEQAFQAKQMDFWERVLSNQQQPQGLGSGTRIKRDPVLITNPRLRGIY
jgi:hypothetical protein